MNRDLFWHNEVRFLWILTRLPCDMQGVVLVDDWRVISEIIRVLKSGGRWNDAPIACGPQQTLCNRNARGVTDLFHALDAPDGPLAELLIVSSAIEAHRSEAGGKEGIKSGDRVIGRSRGRRTTKIHVLTSCVPDYGRSSR